MDSDDARRIVARLSTAHESDAVQDSIGIMMLAMARVLAELVQSVDVIADQLTNTNERLMELEARIDEETNGD